MRAQSVLSYHLIPGTKLIMHIQFGKRYRVSLDLLLASLLKNVMCPPSAPPPLRKKTFIKIKLRSKKMSGEEPRVSLSIPLQNPLHAPAPKNAYPTLA